MGPTTRLSYTGKLTTPSRILTFWDTLRRTSRGSIYTKVLTRRLRIKVRGYLVNYHTRPRLGLSGSITVLVSIIRYKYGFIRLYNLFFFFYLFSSE